MLNFSPVKQPLSFKGSYEPSVAVRERHPQTVSVVRHGKKLPVETLKAYYMPVKNLSTGSVKKSIDLNIQERHNLTRQFSEQLINLSERDKLNISDVQALIHKLAPDIDVRVEDIRANFDLDGKIAQCVTDYPTTDGDCNMVASSTLYVNFGVSDDRIIQNTVHEFTHLLQDNTQPVKIMAEQSRRYGGVNKLSSAFRDFEANFLQHFYIDNLLKHQDSTIQKLEKSTLNDPTKEFDFLTVENIPICEEYFQQALRSSGIKDRSFAIKFFIQQLQDEIEAYNEGFQTKKELANIPVSSPIIQDVVPRLYYQMITFLNFQDDTRHH